MESDPVKVVIKKRDKWRKQSREGSRFWRGVWDKEGRDEFRQRLGGVEVYKEEMEKEWKEMKGRIKKTLKEKSKRG